MCFGEDNTWEVKKETPTPPPTRAQISLKTKLPFLLSLKCIYLSPPRLTDEHLNLTTGIATSL